LVSTLF
jgi:hypothetical protein